MLRITFTQEDLARIRFSVSPAFETVTAVLAVSVHEPVRVRAARATLLRRAGPHAQPLADLLLLDEAHLPDFLTPAPRRDDVSFAEELDAAASVPEWRFTRDSRHLESFARRSPIADGLLGGDREVGKRLLRGFAEVHRAAYGPRRAALRTELLADAVQHRRDLQTLGLDHVLSTLHPSLRWRHPVLTVINNSYDGDYERSGQGLVMVPTVGRVQTVTTMINPWEPVIIGYPLLPRTGALCPSSGRSSPTPDAGPALVRLLGNTRARLLVLVESEPDLTTSEIATRLRISVASASEHASVLRKSDLVRAVRDRNAMRHTVTGLGSGLLRATATQRGGAAGSGPNAWPG